MRKSIGSQHSDDNQDQEAKLDKDFIKTMLDIETRYSSFTKHDKIRIEQWSKKLCQITTNAIWKQNRNNYALLLLNCIINGSLNDPFNKVPPENSLPTLNTHIIVSRYHLL